MSSRTSAYWWSTFTRPRLRSYVRRCSQTKWRPVVLKTKFVTHAIIHLPFFYAASSVGRPWTSRCPCRWETTGHPRRWARGVQGVDIGLYLSSIFLAIWSPMLHLRDNQICKGQEFKVCLICLFIYYFSVCVRLSIKERGSLESVGFISRDAGQTLQCSAFSAQVSKWCKTLTVKWIYILNWLVYIWFWTMIRLKYDFYRDTTSKIKYNQYCHCQIVCWLFPCLPGKLSESNTH